MLELEVLVGELGAVDGLAAGAVVVGEVAALAHEVGDDAVEGGALEAEALLAGAERAEVLWKFGWIGGRDVSDGDGGRRRIVFWICGKVRRWIGGSAGRRFLTAPTRPEKCGTRGVLKMGRPIWSTGRTGGLGGDVRAELWIGEGRGWGFERQCAWFDVTGPARGVSRRVRSVRQISIGRYFSRRSDPIRGDVAGHARRNGSNGHSQSSRCGRRAGRRWTCRRSRRGWTLLSLSSRVEVI